MALHDELLEQARFLAVRNHPNVTEADLRRCVSSAYYALFHLLIAETCLNWSRADSRNALARMFEHAYMRRASGKVTDHAKMPFANEDPVTVGKLRALAGIFAELQSKRHDADYDTARSWTITEATKVVTFASNAFALWNDIRNETIAQ